MQMGHKETLEMQFSEGGQLVPAGEKSLFSYVFNVKACWVILLLTYITVKSSNLSEAKISNVKSLYKPHV